MPEYLVFIIGICALPMIFSTQVFLADYLTCETDDEEFTIKWWLKLIFVHQSTIYKAIKDKLSRLGTVIVMVISLIFLPVNLVILAVILFGVAIFGISYLFYLAFKKRGD